MIALHYTKGGYFTSKDLYPVYPEKPPKYSRYYKDIQDSKEEGIESLYECIYSGGIGGGNCWDEEPNHYYDKSDNQFTYEALHKFMAKVCPTFKFTDSIKLMKLLKHNNYTESEYYGNTSDYSYWYVHLTDIYNLLEDLNYEYTKL